MNKKSWKQSMVFGLLLAVLGIVHSGYVVSILDDGVTPVRWFVDDYPIEIRIWDGFTDQLSSVVDGSDPRAALKEALERWMRTTSVSFTVGEDTTEQDAGFDGVNLVTLADTTTNRDLFSGAAIGLSVGTFNAATGRLIDRDLVLNPAEIWSTLEDDQADVKNIFDVALHEFGHHLNLNHSVSRTSTMFFGGSRPFSFRSDVLSWDDIAGANVTYPMVGLEQITGTITGTVTRQGDPVFGAFVVAVDEQGVLSSNSITLTDGAYELRFLPPGDYSLYVEPLDSPSIPDNITGGIFDQTMVTDFLPKFFNDSMTPSVSVTAGGTTAGRDFQVTQGNSSLDPTFVEAGPDVGMVTSFTSDPGAIDQGVDTNVFVAGTGVDTLVTNQGIFFLSDKLVTGTLNITGQLSNGDPIKAYPVTVPLDTPKGEYPIFLKNNTSEVGVITGGVEVFSPFRFLQAFAQFANIPGAITSGVFLVNTDLNQSVNGKISARGGTGDRTAITLGNLTADANNDLDFTLGAGGSLSVTTSGSLQFVGSLRAQAGRRIGGTVLFESDSGTTGVGPSRPLYSFLAPIEFKGGGTTNTGLALTNLDERPAKVFIQLQNLSGQPVGSTIIDLDPNGQVASFINDLITSLTSDFDGSAVVTANRRIGGTVISTKPGVFTTFPVIQNRIFKRSFFAQFAHVGDLSSKLILLNPSPQRTANVTVQVRDQNGNNASVTLSGEILPSGTKVLSIPPLGSAILETQSQVLGSVELMTQDVPVGGVVLFSSPATGTAGVGESFPQKKFVLPIDRSAPTIDTGIAIVNTRDQQVVLTLTVRDQTGTVVVQKQVTLAAGQQLAEFPNDATFNLGLPDTFVGSLWVEAAGQVGATVIRVSPGNLTTFPVLSL
ncbi:matrixin family metalloprotease, partial [Acidobacteria bacterium AH-259-D05]|nr:matrixin family metalloprotease [Acidobacteria bacterium AH-259-D05]